MKNFKYAQWLAVILGVGLASSCSIGVGAEELAADYASKSPLTLSGNGPWYRVDVPLDVQLKARQGSLADLRVFNAAGQPQAYALVRSESQLSENRNETSVKWFPLYAPTDARQTSPGVRVQRSVGGTLVEVQPDKALEPGEEVRRGWLLDASAIHAPLHQLNLDWASEHDGFQRFTIEASDDLQTWQDWGEGQLARLSFADQRIEQTDVTLPDRSARYVRLLWDDGEQAPVLTSAKLVSIDSSIAPAPLVWSPPFVAQRDKSGAYLWNFPVGLAVERVQVEIKQPNTLAPVSLEGRRDELSGWQPAGAGLLYRLARDGKDESIDQLALSGQRIQQLKMHVDERGGGLGDAAPTVKLALRATQLVFLARGEGPYSLAIGNPKAAVVNLPLETLIPGYEPKRMASLGQATLGEITTLKVEPLAPVVPGTDWKRYGLWAVLLAGVALLGGMAFSLLRAPVAKP